MALLEECVKVGEEALPELDHLPAHRLVGFAKCPRFLMSGAFNRMVSTKRLKNPKFGKTCEQLAVVFVEEAAHVHSGPGYPREPHVLELGHAHPHVLPPTRVVPCPLQRMALQPRVPGAGDDERSLVGPQPQQTLAYRAGHQGAVSVVDLAVQLGLVLAA